MADVISRMAEAVMQDLNRRYSVDEFECASAVRAALQALRYRDGIDEDIAISAGGAIGVDAVIAIECHEAWIDAALASHQRMEVRCG